MALIGTEAQFVNEFRNFPSMEKIGALPVWWQKTANATVTQSTTVTEGITQTYQEVLKIVTSASGPDYAAQRYTYADERRIKSGRTLSMIVAIWSVGGVHARARLQSSAGSLGVSADVTTAAWNIVQVSGVVLNGTWVEPRFEVDTGTAYFVPLGCMIGNQAIGLRARGLIYHSLDAPPTIKTWTGLGNENAWTNINVNANTSNLAVLAEITGRVQCGGNWVDIYLRRNGDTTANQASQIFLSTRNVTFEEQDNTRNIILDASQIFQYLLGLANGGTLGFGELYINGYWEWE